MRRATTLIVTALTGASTFAQEPKNDWLVETLYRSGKINTVIAVVAVLIAGLAVWMFRMDRRIRRMEREQEKQG